MKHVITLLTVALLAAQPIWPLFAQRPAVTPARTPAPTDSTRRVQTAADTIPEAVQRNGIRVGTSTLVPDADSATLAGTDTLRLTPNQEAQIRKIIPRQATIRSLILPGLGQAYNRQYYKIPFIYGGFGAIGYFFVRYSRLSKEAENGYRLLLYGRPDGNGSTAKVSEVLIGQNIFSTTSGAKNAYDFYRRYRDLNIILSVVLYAINAVEANVAAHLKTFDLSDDISMRVEPNVLPVPGAGIVPGVRVALTFK